jgi:RecJ-like exonuclease
MRRVFIIAALTGTVFLQVCTWKKPPVMRSPKEQVQSANEGANPVLMLANISAALHGDRITVAGQVSDIWEPAGKRAPHTLILRDRSGVLEVVHWLKHPPPRVDIGDSVECTGTVDLYRGGLQLRLWTPGDLQVVNP